MIPWTQKKNDFILYPSEKLTTVIGLRCPPTKSVFALQMWRERRLQVSARWVFLLCRWHGIQVTFPEIGWQGDLCDVPLCKRNCDPLQGYCKRPNECRCKLGFYGENCERCIPLPGCQNGGCRQPFECHCHKGYQGIFCQERENSIYIFLHARHTFSRQSFLGRRLLRCIINSLPV